MTDTSWVCCFTRACVYPSTDCGILGDVTDDERALAVNAAVARAIAAETAAQGMSVPELAERAGMVYGTLNNYVKHGRVIPLTALYKIADALGMDVQTLWTKAMERLDD